MTAGATRSEAERCARMEFGSIDGARDDCRQARGVSFVDALGQDLRYALRVLRRSPGFALLCIGIMAVGIGANTAIFSVVNAVLLRPLPYREPTQLVRVYSEFPTMQLRKFWLSPPELLDIQKEAKSWEAIGAWAPGGQNIGTDSEPLRVTAAAVTRGLIDTLGVQPGQ